MKAVIIGAGRVGCGFAGQLLRESDYQVTFVVRNPVMVDHLNRVGHYRVRLVMGSSVQETIVDQVRAVASAESEQVAEDLAEADVIITAVGADNLIDIAPLIAAGLQRRTSPVNVLVFENLEDAGGRLRRLVGEHLPPGFDLSKHGFSGVLVSRIVSRRLGDPASDDLLTFVGDPPATFVVDGPSLRQTMLPINGMIVAENFAAWMQRKLYTYSAGHATTAYLGYLKGYHYIHTAIRDPEIREAVLAAMTEGQRGLETRYGPEVAGSEDDLLEIISHFENAALNDPIVRVARDPKRKLGAEDRLVGAARLAKQAGINPETLVLATAAALLFENPDDPSATELQQEIRAVGLGPALWRVSGLDISLGLGHFIADVWSQLAVGWQKGNQLLSLRQSLWAWS